MHPTARRLPAAFEPTRTGGALLAVCLASAIGLASAAGAQPATSTSADWPSVQAVFGAKCTACHGADRADEGLRLDSWEHVFRGSDHGAAVVPYSPRHSLALQLAVNYTEGSHPGELEAPPLSDDEIDRLRTWIEAGAPDSSGNIAFDDDGPRLYATNQGAASVSVVDIAGNRLARVVDLAELGFTPGSMPHHVVVEPDGSYWYVSLIVDNAVLKFNRKNELVGRAEVERPGLLALDPTGPWLFAGRSMISVSPPQSLARIDRRNMDVEEVELLMHRPHALAVTKDGRYTYASSLSENRIAVIDNLRDEITFTDVAGDAPHVFIGFAIAPSGDRMVATSEVSSKLFVFDLEDPVRPVLSDTVAVGRAPWHPVFTPDGSSVYFGNNWTNTVTVVDIDRPGEPAVITGPGLAQPHGAAASPDGRFVYVSSRNLAMPEGHSKEDHVYVPRYDLGHNRHAGTIAVIDTRTREIVHVIESGAYTSGLGIAHTSSEPTGGLRGRVLFRGQPPEPLRLLITKDIEVCGSGYRERREVDVTTDGGLRNVVVYLEDDPGSRTWDDLDTGHAVDQRDCFFQPHIQVVPAQAEMSIVNSDSTLHNIHAYELIGRARRSLFNISQPESETVRQRLMPQRSGRVSLECDSHDFMQGWIFAADHPWATVVDSTGAFGMPDLPPGTHTVSAWHPKLGVQTTEVTVTEQQGATIEFIFEE